MPHVYILKCGVGSFYVGSARILEVRVAEHQAGSGCAYTSKRQPVGLVFCEWFDRIDDAFAREKQVQGWGRAKRQALIDGRFDDLPRLSASKEEHDNHSMAHSDDPDVLAAIAGELALLQPVVRADAAKLESLLADDFQEVGKSGRLWSRSEIVEMLTADSGSGAIEAVDMQATRLGEGLVLVWYVSVTDAGSARRSSIWRRESGGWRIVFHQGTQIL